jgi:hypothetical protein
MGTSSKHRCTLWGESKGYIGVSATAPAETGKVRYVIDPYEQLPWLLAAFAERIRTLVKVKAPLLLESDRK